MGPITWQSKTFFLAVMDSVLLLCSLMFWFTSIKAEVAIRDDWRWPTEHQHPTDDKRWLFAPGAVGI